MKNPDCFTNLSISSFRRLENVEFQLRPLCVMIGANGVGKTSILDVLSLLASSAAGRLSSSLSELGGLSNVLSYGGKKELYVGTNSAAGDEGPMGYELVLQPQSIAYQIAREKLWLRRGSDEDEFLYIDSRGSDVQYREDRKGELLRPNWEYNTLETSLSQVPKMFRALEEFRSRLASSTFYHVLDVSPRSPVRLPQPMQPATLPGKNGEELISCLYNLRELERNRFEAIEDALRAAFPRFERLDFPPVAAGTLALLWREKGVSKPFYMNQLSEGTLRFLWLATLLQSPDWLDLLHTTGRTRSELASRAIESFSRTLARSIAKNPDRSSHAFGQADQVPRTKRGPDDGLGRIGRDTSLMGRQS